MTQKGGMPPDAGAGEATSTVASMSADQWNVRRIKYSLL
jgi:hypothetical protein